MSSSIPSGPRIYGRDLCGDCAAIAENYVKPAIEQTAKKVDEVIDKTMRMTPFTMIGLGNGAIVGSFVGMPAIGAVVGCFVGACVEDQEENEQNVELNLPL